MSTGAFVLAAVLVIAAEIAFALAYGNGLGMSHRHQGVEVEFERALHAVVTDAFAIGGEDRRARTLEEAVTARSAAPADRLR